MFIVISFFTLISSTQPVGDLPLYDNALENRSFGQVLENKLSFRDAANEYITNIRNTNTGYSDYNVRTFNPKQLLHQLEYMTNRMRTYI